MSRKLGRQRGVSLIEALVAFGVMAFGMMAVIGMQSTLRGNGDLARQRAEAVRIAQDTLEASRSFTVLDSTTGRRAYVDLSDTTNAVDGQNATYAVTRRVTAEAPVAGTMNPERRTLVVDVGWTDRSGQAQSVRLASVVAGIEPALTASIITAANPDPVVTPGGRHRGIPPSAVPLQVGRSGYVPPGQGNGSGPRVAWVFNNTTGVITLCSTSAVTTSELLFSGNTPSCGNNQQALLLTGAVRFATAGNPADSPTSMADPAGSSTDFALQVRLAGAGTGDGGGSAELVTCYRQDRVNDEVRFYCAVPISPDRPRWSGALEFTSPLLLATSPSSISATHFKVCRYHAAASYAEVGAALLSQNFAIIRAGDGSVPYECPTAATFSPRTWPHQPS